MRYRKLGRIVPYKWRHGERLGTGTARPGDGGVQVFRSENLWFDPTDDLKREAVTVYVDPRNPRRYAMDVSFLPKLA